MTIVFIVKQNNYMTKPILLLSQNAFYASLDWMFTVELKTWPNTDLDVNLYISQNYPLAVDSKTRKLKPLCQPVQNSCAICRERAATGAIACFVSCGYVSHEKKHRIIKLKSFRTQRGVKKKKLRQNSNCSEKTTTAFHQWKQKKRQTDILYIALHSRAL